MTCQTSHEISSPFLFLRFKCAWGIITDNTLIKIMLIIDGCIEKTFGMPNSMLKS